MNCKNIYPKTMEMLEAIVAELPLYGEPFRVYPKDLIIEVITDRNDLYSYLVGSCRLNNENFSIFETTLIGKGL